jgi:hypothetical protein
LAEQSASGRWPGVFVPSGPVAVFPEGSSVGVNRNVAGHL